MSITYGIGRYVRSVSRFDGTIVSNGYNSAGRLSQVVYPDETETFSYLKNGRLRTAINSSGIVSNNYNAYNRITTVFGVGPAARVDYGYFPAGRLSKR